MKTRMKAKTRTKAGERKEKMEEDNAEKENEDAKLCGNELFRSP